MRRRDGSLPGLGPVILLCVLILAIVTTATYLIYQQSAVILRQRAERQLERELRAARNTTRRAITSLVDDLQMLARQPGMIRILDLDVDRQIADLLDTALRRSPYVIDLTCRRLDGQLIAWSGSLDQPAETTKSDTDPCSASEAVLQPAAPPGHNIRLTIPVSWVFDRRERIGCLQATVSMDAFLEVEEQWWVALADSSGKLVVQHGPDLGREVPLGDNILTHPDHGEIRIRSAEVPLPDGVQGPVVRRGRRPERRSAGPRDNAEENGPLDDSRRLLGDALPGGRLRSSTAGVDEKTRRSRSGTRASDSVPRESKGRS
ncbi:MAG: hypothetical protein Q9Q13_09410 [Acidobacteriota bacterium]|nr:hypothetical protein [Acidobacteriota bacterium]